SAFLQSIMPAPVFSRSSFTRLAVISAMSHPFGLIAIVLQRVTPAGWPCARLRLHRVGAGVHGRGRYVRYRDGVPQSRDEHVNAPLLLRAGSLQAPTSNPGPAPGQPRRGSRATPALRHTGGRGCPAHPYWAAG